MRRTRVQTHLLQTTDLDSLFNSDIHTVLAGNLNAKHRSWNNRVNNSSALARYLDSRLDAVVASTNTLKHFSDNSNHRPQVLDIALMKTSQLNYQLSNFTLDISLDHSPLILDLFPHSTLSSPTKSSHITDWKIFEETINSTHLTPPNISTSQDIDNSIEHIFNFISSTHSNCTTTINPNYKSHILSNSILREIKLIRRLRSLWQRSREPSIKT